MNRFKVHREIRETCHYSLDAVDMEKFKDAKYTQFNKLAEILNKHRIYPIQIINFGSPVFKYYKTRRSLLVNEHETQSCQNCLIPGNIKCLIGKYEANMTSLPISPANKSHDRTKVSLREILQKDVQSLKKKSPKLIRECPIYDVIGKYEDVDETSFTTSPMKKNQTSFTKSDVCHISDCLKSEV